ncbi:MULTISPECIES: TetR/AcrR family transcriptional regulator [Actinosynnema]|uniref:TetR/AcrR family transcriptional regulator n=1 Tax=Actinosynnema TaxID=40566 RepID=UPI0020A2416B|nr:TetR/AcrR family transcriptional regulator [Actinosynnema pretiosum]MCP2098233.1 transcriptional regulator, TetR family [Actinosynnema pretiosum]
MTEAKTRRRGEELERAILDAVWDELDEVGYDRLTIDGVAARARTSKPVIYRRWPSRAEMVLAAWLKRAPSWPGPEDQGDLRTDLLALFSGIAGQSGLCSGGGEDASGTGMAWEAFHNPEVIVLVSDKLLCPSPLRHALDGVVERAVDRGELPPVELPERVKRVPLDLIRSESLTRCGPLSRRVLEELVDDVFLPLLHGLAQRGGAPTG